jgi:hypothetical protein
MTPAEEPTRLGLSVAQQAAYELLVDRHTGTAAELAAGWPCPEPLDDVLAGLVDAGLAHSSSGRYTAIAPRVVFDARLDEDWRRLRAAREHADRLARDYRAGAEVVEVLAGGTARERLLAALRSAETEVRQLVTEADPDPAVLAAVAIRGVPFRALHRTPPPADRAVPGQQTRVYEPLPLPLYLIDDRLAVIPVDGEDALVVHPSELLRALSLLFEGLWERAGPLPRPAAGDPEPDRLVELLLAGLTDEAISRALGISPRTAQRRVAAMMAATGARTRFQAGVQVALRQTRA